VLQSFVDVDSFIRCALSGTGYAAATCGCGLGLDTCGLVNITDTIRYDTIRDAILTCARKPT